MAQTKLTSRVRELRSDLIRLEDKMAKVTDGLVARAREELMPALNKKIRAIQANAPWNYSLGEIMVSIRPSTYEELTDRELPILPELPNTVSLYVVFTPTVQGREVRDNAEYDKIYREVQPAVKDDLDGFSRRYGLDSTNLIGCV